MRQGDGRTAILRRNHSHTLHRSSPVGQDGSALRGSVCASAQERMRTRTKTLGLNATQIDTANRRQPRHPRYISERRYTAKVDQHFPKGIFNIHSRHYVFSRTPCSCPKLNTRDWISCRTCPNLHSGTSAKSVSSFRLDGIVVPAAEVNS